MENEIEEKRTNLIVPEGTEVNYIVASREQPAIGHADEVKKPMDHEKLYAGRNGKQQAENRS